MKSKLQVRELRPGEDRRDHLLEAACKVFADAGYQTASMREIARVAGITQAAIYYHFKGKEEILHSILTRFSDGLLRDLMSIMAQPLSPHDKVIQLAARQIDLVPALRKELRLLIEDKHNLSPEHLKQIQIKERMIFEVYRNCLGEIQRQGAMRDMDPVTTAFNILGTINWLYHWYRENGALGFDRIRDSTLAFIRHGIGGTGGISGGAQSAVTRPEAASPARRTRRARAAD